MSYIIASGLSLAFFTSFSAIGFTMDTAEAWRSLFENWPETIARDGSVVTATGDQIPFCGFLISGGLLLVERSRPDPSGNRKVMLTYDAISAVNLTSNAEMSKFQCMGFQPPL